MAHVLDRVRPLQRLGLRLRRSSALARILVFVLVLAEHAAATTAAAVDGALAAAKQSPATYPRSSKRGLISIVQTNPAPFINFPHSDLTWYYNYSPTPDASIPAGQLSFVPQLWGDTADADAFLATVRQLVDAGGNAQNVTAVLAFNEPDACSGGGSCVSAARAAHLWKTQIEPLHASHPALLLGSPATTGSTQGLAWLRAWFAACAGGCTPDFLAAHYYGNFAGLTAYLGQLHATYPNVSKARNGGIWLTEFNDPRAPHASPGQLRAAQAYFNTTVAWLDALAWVARYAYFGSFASDVSNVGPDVAMLDSKGRLTSIGSWYLGGPSTDNIPTGGASGGRGARRWGVLWAAAVAVGMLF